MARIDASAAVRPTNCLMAATAMSRERERLEELLSSRRFVSACTSDPKTVESRYKGFAKELSKTCATTCPDSILTQRCLDAASSLGKTMNALVRQSTE